MIIYLRRYVEIKLMKKLLNKLNEMQTILVIGLMVSVFLCLICLLPLFLANQPGWLIGVAIGSVVGLFNVFMTYKGSEVALKTFKAYSFLFFYFTKIVLLLVSLVVCALFQFGFNYGDTNYFAAIPAFNYSLYAVLIGYVPMQIVLIITMAKSKKSVLTISENLKKDDQK